MLVLGCGAFGSLAVQIAKLHGAGRVVAADRGGERLERLRERGADAVVALDEEDDLAAAYRTAAGGDLDVTIDTLWGDPAAAAIQAAGRHARHVQVGHVAGPTITLPAPALRSVSLDLRGFRVDLPPPERAPRRDSSTSRATSRRATSPSSVEALPLERGRDGLGAPGAGPRAAASSSWFLDRASRAWKGAGQPEGEEPTLSEIEAGRPVVLRGGTVLTMNDAHEVLHGADVLVVGEQIAGVGPSLEVPDGTVEIDASDGIVMPGMIDTHRHMWQTALRGYGADWTLAQYFVFFYLEWGKVFRPQDIHAGNLLSAIESLDAGVTTTVDWSHGLQTVDHAEAAVDALQAVPGRFVLAYGNLQQGPWEWSASKDFRAFVERRFGSRDDMLGFQMAFDVTGDPEFPEKAAFEVARELGVPVTTHAGVWGATNDDGIRLMHEHGCMEPGARLRARRDADRGLLPPDRGHAAAPCRSRPSPSRAPARATRRPGSCASTTSRSRSRWTRACGGAATCSARCARRSAPTARASTWRRTPSRRRSPTTTCGPSRSSTGRRAAAPRRSGWTTASAALEPGKKADVVLVKNEHSPVMFPVLHPYGHVAFQAQRADVHTVIVNGRVVKRDGRLVGIDLAAARRAIDETVDVRAADDRRRAWKAGMHPEIPETRILTNPYQYTKWDA